MCQWLENCSGSNIRERDRRKLSALQPVNRCRIDGYSFLSANIWAVFEVSMLSFLLCLKVKACSRTSEIWRRRIKNTHASNDRDSFSRLPCQLLHHDEYARGCNEQRYEEKCRQCQRNFTVDITYEHHQSALLLMYRRIIFSIAVGIPGTFQGTKANLSSG